MPDQSHLDDKYFIDDKIYNCPFCNRRHVSYAMKSVYAFDWTSSKKCYCFLAECFSCNNVSMHLSFTNIDVYRAGSTTSYLRFNVAQNPDLDQLFFLSSSHFVFRPRFTCT
jgi:transcription elongation factor Elf1